MPYFYVISKNQRSNRFPTNNFIAIFSIFTLVTLYTLFTNHCFVCRLNKQYILNTRLTLPALLYVAHNLLPFPPYSFGMSFVFISSILHFFAKQIWQKLSFCFTASFIFCKTFTVYTFLVCHFLPQGSETCQLYSCSRGFCASASRWNSALQPPSECSLLTAHMGLWEVLACSSPAWSFKTDK